MAAYYNEIDEYAARWLRNLISRNIIAPGDVDTRDIRDVAADDLKGYDQCHFFAGIGVWSYALRSAGWEDSLPVWTGSCPCQPFSTAGFKLGEADERHLWGEFRRLITGRLPRVVLGEQVASPMGIAWFDGVAGDCEALGYAAGAVRLSARCAGAPHLRRRLYWSAVCVGNADGAGREGLSEDVADAASGQVDAGYGSASGLHGNGGTGGSFWEPCDRVAFADGRWRPVECGTYPLVDGSSDGVGRTRTKRLRCYGNALVAPQARLFVESVMDMLDMYSLLP